MAADDDFEPTYPAQAQYRVLRAVAHLAEQAAQDFTNPESSADLADLFSTRALEDLDRQVLARALIDLARELKLRANLLWDSNTEYLKLCMKDGRRN